MSTSMPAREFHEPGFCNSSAQFLRRFVVSANLRNTIWSFYRGETDSPRESPRLSANLPPTIAQRNIKILARKNSLAGRVRSDGGFLDFWTACPPVRLSACPPVRLFACPPVRLSACLGHASRADMTGFLP